MWRSKSHWLDPQLQKLVFNDPSFTVLRLVGQHTLKTEDVDKLAQALEGNTKLRELNLRGNSLGGDDVRKLVRALEGKTGLQCINLSINGLGNEGASLIADALRVNCTLTALFLTGCSVFAQGAASIGLALKCNSTLLHLSLGKNEIGDDGIRFVAEALAHEIPLTELDVHACAITSEGIARLADALKSNSMLTKLDLNSNKVSDDGAGKLAYMLQTNSTLKELDLGSVEMGSLGASSLAEGLAANRALTHLRLPCNMIGNDGAKRLAEIIGIMNYTLRELGLECNPLDSKLISHLEDCVECNIARHEGRPPRKEILPHPGINHVMLSKDPKDVSNTSKVSATTHQNSESPPCERNVIASAGEDVGKKGKPKDKLVCDVLADLGIGALPRSSHPSKSHDDMTGSVAFTSAVNEVGEVATGLSVRDALIESMLSDLGGDCGRPPRHGEHSRHLASAGVRAS